MAKQRFSMRNAITREAALLLGFLFLGLVLLPIAIYIVGQAIFGDYGGGSYGHFYSELSSRVRAGDGDRSLARYPAMDPATTVRNTYRLGPHRPDCDPDHIPCMKNGLSNQFSRGLRQQSSPRRGLGLMVVSGAVLANKYSDGNYHS